MNFPVRKILTIVFLVAVVSGLGLLVACGTRFGGVAGNHKVGYIYYSDGFAHSRYFSHKTPIGIVVEVNSNGYASKIVSLYETTDTAKRAWSKEASGASGESLSEEEGQRNTTIIKQSTSNLQDEFPAFNYCINYGTTNNAGGTWYLPAIKELESLKENLVLIETGLDEIPVESKNEIQYAKYWSSTQNSGGDKAWVYNFSSGSKEPTSKTTELLVRPFRKVR